MFASIIAANTRPELLALKVTVAKRQLFGAHNPPRGSPAHILTFNNGVAEGWRWGRPRKKDLRQLVT